MSGLAVERSGRGKSHSLCIDSAKQDQRAWLEMRNLFPHPLTPSFTQPACLALGVLLSQRWVGREPESPTACHTQRAKKETMTQTREGSGHLESRDDDQQRGQVHRVGDEEEDLEKQTHK